jgi:hypothetical protein
MKSQLPTELYMKIDHDGRDYFMIAMTRLPHSLILMRFRRLASTA